MSRRTSHKPRIPAPDAVYNSVEVSSFINRLMMKGKRTVAEKIFYKAVDRLEGKTEDKGIDVFLKALSKAKPLVRVKARRVGGSTYQVPIEVKEHEGMAIGNRWIIKHARERRGRTMEEKLANELLDIYNGTGGTMKKREDTHKMAEANKAFAHYRF